MLNNKSPDNLNSIEIKALNFQTEALPLIKEEVSILDLNFMENNVKEIEEIEDIFSDTNNDLSDLYL